MKTKLIWTLAMCAAVLFAAVSLRAQPPVDDKANSAGEVTLTIGNEARLNISVVPSYQDGLRGQLPSQPLIAATSEDVADIIWEISSDKIVWSEYAWGVDMIKVWEPAGGPCLGYLFRTFYYRARIDGTNYVSNIAEVRCLN